jgi:hypothetical protein
MAKQPRKRPPQAPGLTSVTATSPLSPEPPLFPLKKPRGKGKPFLKGKDPRRVHGRKKGQVNAGTRQLRQVLMQAAENTGNRLAELFNAELPHQPTRAMTAEMLRLLRRDPKGIVSYFEWLAEDHPAIFSALLGRVLTYIMQQEGSSGEEMMSRSEDVETAFGDRGLPPLQKVSQVPKRIELNDPPTIDTTLTDNEHLPRAERSAKAT